MVMGLNPAITVPRKRRTKRKTSDGSGTTPDIISNLPDSILCHILSFVPTKYAVRTGALSLRWKDIWVSVPNLDLEVHFWRKYPDDYELVKKNFVRFVYRTLTLRRNLRTKKFRFSSSDAFDPKYLYAWVNALLRCNLEELDIGMTSHHLIRKLHWNFSVCTALVVLKLNGVFAVSIPENASFPNLKTLFLESVLFPNDESVQKLLSSCPVLEDLELNRPNEDRVRNCVISVPSLKRLALHFDCLKGDPDEDDDYYLSGSDSEESDNTSFKEKRQLFVDAPNLEYFKLNDYLSNEIVITHMPHISEARISVGKCFLCDDPSEKFVYESDAFGILRAVSNVKRLFLSGDTLRTLLHSPRTGKPIFKNLVHLELGFDEWNGPVLLPTLLKLSPKLEILFLSEGISNPGEQRHNLEDNMFFDYEWEPPKNVPKCITSTLAIVAICNFCGEAEEDLKLVKYFLTNARVLKMMTIFFHNFRNHDNGMDCFSAQKKYLEEYPRGSPSSEIKIYTPILQPIR